MTGYILIKLLTVSAALTMAGAVLSRDPGLRMHRLLAAVMTCTAWWALCEVAWNLTDDPGVAIWIVRASALGWLLVGPIFFDIYVELAGSYRSRMSRVVPLVYGASFFGLALYVGTPWCLVALEKTAWGWGFEFGPLFVVPFLIASIPPTLVVASWRVLYPKQGSGGERSVSRTAVIGVSTAVVVASATDALLPFVGVQTPPLGSTAIAVAALGVTQRLRRYGYSLLSAGAFAQEILATLPDGVVLLHSDGSIRDSNAALRRLVGMSPHHLYRRPVEELLPSLSGEPAERRAAIEGTLVGASGVRTPVLIAPPILCRAGERVLGTAVVVRDQRELIDLRSRLMTSARLASVGDLSLGIAEHITTPIGAVGDSLKALEAQWAGLRGEIVKALPSEQPSDEELEIVLSEGGELIEECLEGVTRIKAITRDVRGFAGASHARREAADLVQIAEGALRMALPRAGPGLSVVRDFRSVPPVIASDQEIEQVLLNLLINAFHATGQAGEVRVFTDCRDTRVFVAVQDDGSGINDEILDRIFDPFFTTKPVGEGTGLGLAISYHIVKNHGGEIRVATSARGGSTFTVELPRA